MALIYPLKAFDDNYIWVVQHLDSVIVVDPGDAQPVLEHLEKNQLTLQEIWITHHHGDHIGGVKALKTHYPDVNIRGHKALGFANINHQDNDAFEMFGLSIQVWDIPGHTATHQAYLLNDTASLHIFCGDTVFSAGCGRVFDGTIEDLYQSFLRFSSLPDNTLFYPAHEYTANNLKFAAAVEPNNHNIIDALEKAQNSHLTLPVTLAHEKTINPFFRINQPAIWQAVENEGFAAKSNEEVFAALREWKNRF